MRIVINGKEITNPFALAIVRVLAVVLLSLLLVLVLPLIGITVALSLTIILAAMAAVLLVLWIGILWSRLRKPRRVPLAKPKDE